MAYVYRHIRLDKNEPFYIGIGKTPYRATSRQNRNSIWKKIVDKTDFIVEIIFSELEWKQASDKEIEFIKLYGRLDRGTGSLANMTDGGDGNLGLVHSAASIATISAASKGRAGYWKGKRLPIEMKNKQSESRRGVPLLKNRGKTISDEHKRAVGNAHKGNKYSLGRVWTREMREKLSKSKIGKPSSMRGLPAPWLLGDKNGMYGKKQSAESIKMNKESQKTRRPTLQIDKNNGLIAEYASLSDAASAVGGFTSGVQAACKGRAPSYKGFLWKYKE